MSAHEKNADVLLVLPVLDPSGAERVVAELAKRLPAFGFPASVLCLENDNAAVGVELKRAGVRVDGLHLSRRRTFACANGIHRRIMEFPEDASVILCSQLFHANIAARLALGKLAPARRSKVRVVSTIQVAERRFRPWQFWLDRATSRLAAREICVSNSVMDYHRSKTGLPASFFKVVYNGTDLTRFLELETPRAGAAVRVVSVGRLNRQKDYPTLLRAWKIVAQKFPQAKLELAGSGPEQTNLVKLCAALKLENVHFAGFQPDVAAFLKGAHLYVQSSAWEGMPLSIVEAMAAGLPVLASAVDGIPELIAHGRTGMLFDRGDAAQLAALMSAELSDPPHAQALGAAARQAARTSFSAERMTMEYASTFKALLEQKPRGKIS